MDTDAASLISIKSTSNKTADCQDIELRLTETSRLIFRPQLIDNIHDQKACVRGVFIYQRKSPKGSWHDYPTTSLAKLKDSEGFKLILKSRELHKLVGALNSYYKIYSRYGIPSGKTNFLITPEKAKNLLERLIQNPNNLAAMQELEVTDLEQLNLISKVSALKKVFIHWKQNQENDGEEFWQQELTKHTWAIAQVFCYPVTILNGKGYVGGKNINNKGGKLADFLFKNCLTENVLIVEIKTPMTKLLGSEYRDNVHSISDELSGSIVQVLNYKDTLQKNFYTLAHESKQAFQAFNPKCMIIAGTLPDPDSFLNTEAELQSLELFRSDSKQVEIVTFDELFKKVELLIRLFEK